MVLLNIPSKDLLQALIDELETKYHIRLIKRRFYGFRISTGYMPVNIVSNSNVSRIAWLIARDKDLSVIEVFSNNSCEWQLEQNKSEKK